MGSALNPRLVRGRKQHACDLCGTPIAKAALREVRHARFSRAMLRRIVDDVGANGSITISRYLPSPAGCLLDAPSHWIVAPELGAALNQLCPGIADEVIDEHDDNEHCPECGGNGYRHGPWLRPDNLQSCKRCDGRGWLGHDDSEGNPF